MVKIDQLDRKILGVLQHQADIPLEEIGQRVGLSRNACWRRIRAMEEARIITGRVALLDAAQLDLGLMVFIQLRAAQHDAGWLDQFARAVRALPEIVGVYRMSGDIDYLLKARVRDVTGYDALYQRLIEKVDLRDVSASFVMEDLKDSTALPL